MGCLVPDKDIRSSGTEVEDLWGTMWVLGIEPALQEQPLLLTLEAALQAHNCCTSHHAKCKFVWTAIFSFFSQEPIA